MTLRGIACLKELIKFPGCTILQSLRVPPVHGFIVSATVSRYSTATSRTFIPLRSIPITDLGHSILVKDSKNISMEIVGKGGMLSSKMVFIAKILSLSSSAVGLAMIPVMSQLISQKPGSGAIAAVIDSFVILYAFTPVLLHQIFVKRYVVDLYYNTQTEIFTSVHFGFFLGKKALRFRAEDVVDSNLSPDMFKLWFPLATVVVHRKPLMLCLNEEIYTDVEIFKKLTKNIKSAS